MSKYYKSRSIKIESSGEKIEQLPVRSTIQFFRLLIHLSEILNRFIAKRWLTLTIWKVQELKQRLMFIRTVFTHSICSLRSEKSAKKQQQNLKRNIWIEITKITVAVNYTAAVILVLLQTIKKPTENLWASLLFVAVFIKRWVESVKILAV